MYLLATEKKNIANCIFLNVANNIQSGILCNLFGSGLLNSVSNVRLVFIILCECFVTSGTAGFLKGESS